MISSDTDRLADLVARKQACLLRLRALGTQQAECIASDGLGELLKLLAVKQAVIDQLQEVERQLDPFRGQDPDTRAWPTPQARARCAALADDCDRLLREILEQELASEQRLRVRRDDAATQLAQAHHTAEARGAYTAAWDAAPTTLDLSSGG